jgi:hypothetical protein
MNKHTTPPADPEQRDGPSLFVGIQLEVEEIIIGRNVINAKCVALRSAMDARHEAAVKQAADEIAVIAGQMQALSSHLASVIARHQARRPRT